jgi:hypothetical protein
MKVSMEIKEIDPENIFESYIDVAWAFADDLKKRVVTVKDSEDSDLPYLLAPDGRASLDDIDLIQKALVMQALADLFLKKIYKQRPDLKRHWDGVYGGEEPENSKIDILSRAIGEAMVATLLKNLEYKFKSKN